VATTAEPTPESPGALIGPYKLLEPIGEGGMGTVWMAQQTEPVKRVVALKVIKPGMGSGVVNRNLSRFISEIVTGSGFSCTVICQRSRRLQFWEVSHGCR
jgi:hypothetical protein